MNASKRRLTQVTVTPTQLDRLAGLLAEDRAEHLRRKAHFAHGLLEGRVVWNINSTASGGGVAEMLETLLAYGLGAGIDTRWLVLDGDPVFFELTKRLHNRLHGYAGDGGDLGPEQAAVYSRVLAEHHDDLLSRVRPGDIAILHDPQTGGLVDVLVQAGVHVVWRCHIGSDTQNQWTKEGWEFLQSQVQSAHAFVFSRAAYVPAWVPLERLYVIAPSIDPLSVKNRDLSAAEVSDVLGLVSLQPGGESAAPVTVAGRDGSTHSVQRRTSLVVGGLPPPPADAPLVVQVSRWDRLKDMLGVMTTFTEFVAEAHPSAHLLLVGPATDGVSDDPEGALVLKECVQGWERLTAATRSRVHLVGVPMDDLAENALIVNAIQRRAAVVVQKSLAEGFGLTVTEAMWKARPVVASAVGGIPDQIVSGEQGILVDPSDLAACGEAQRRLLGDHALAARLGSAARRRVQEEFLGDRHLLQYLTCFEALLS